jgi:UDPglucose--hexose-1-phosphate uridylyltransferase
MSEFRKDPLLDSWTIIDSSRKINKVLDYGKYPEDVSKCPFCPGNEFMAKHDILTIAKEGDLKNWELRVVPNAKPILNVETVLKKEADGIYDKMYGVGAHEIFIETPQHFIKPQNVPMRYYETLYKALTMRIKDLRKDGRLEYILFFKNHGEFANALLEHPHSQLIAMPTIPSIIKTKIDSSRDYFDSKERCVFCDIIAQEISSSLRIVYENDLFISFCPYASRYPFETWIFPKNHQSDFDFIAKDEIESLTKIIREVLSKISKTLDNCSYNYMLHTGPLKNVNIPFYHWYISIKPAVVNDIGFEWDSGLYVNPVAPEYAAKFLRELY